MNVPGPSRPVPPPRRREGVDSTYEQDLLDLLGHLTIDEMDDVQSFFSHRTNAGEPLSDRDIAMNDLLQQARALAVINEDRLLAQRIAVGEHVGAEPPLHHRAIQETRANNLSGISCVAVTPRHMTLSPRDAPPSWGGWLSSVVDWVFGSQTASKPSPSQRPVNTASKTKVHDRPTGHDCVICQDPIYGSEISAPCGHHYDIGCVTDLFQSATRDETLYPPRCCRQNIPFAQVRPHLSQALVTTFLEKHAEFTTLKRVYCSSPTCSRFLGPVSEGMFFNKVYTCPAPGCGRRTCGKCREQCPGDWTHVCRPDADASQVLELSRASGWSRCPGCSQMIELNIGCFHMTCRCRTEFCYLCRARWKTCPCPQWDERRLLVAAEERVDAQLGADRGRVVRRGVPPQRPHPAPAPVPVLLPARNPLAQVGARPAPVQRAAPATTPARPVTLAQPIAPVRVPLVLPPRPQPTPARTVQAATSPLTSRRPAPVATTSVPPPQTSSNTSNFARAPSASTSASTSSSSSGQAPAPKSARNTDPLRQRLVREMMERLRVDHECDHGKWRYRNGGGICQSCGHHLPLYLFRCQGCEMLACNRCRRNRL